MFLRVYKPELFQGNLKLKRYFEGWYYKHSSQDLDHVYSFIPGISLAGDSSHCFIQIINGISGRSDYISYSLDEFRWSRDKLSLRIGRSEFTDHSISLHIHDKDISVEGNLDYYNITRYPKKLFSPGIMGWYSFVPFMECKHGIVSVNHNITGSIKVNGEQLSFDQGKGYIEKDWGKSFPEAWIWIQANNFSNNETCFSFSVAKIPWLGKFFIGFIAFLYTDRKYYLFSTYNKSSLSDMKHNERSIEFSLTNNDHILKILATKNTFGELRAPVSGDMSRRIKESIDSEVKLSLFDKNDNLIYTDTGKRAGLEVVEKIFEYIKQDLKA